MRVLVDTCVVIDYFERRDPFFQDAHRLFLAIANQQIEGLISSNTVTDIYYLLHRFLHNDPEVRKLLETLFKLVTILDTTGTDCRKALLSPVRDYEDAVIVEMALREGADCIVTRNTKDFIKADLPVLSPKMLLQNLRKRDLRDDV